MLQHAQQFVLAPVQPGEQPIEGCVVGFALEDAIKARPQCSGPSGCSATIWVKAALPRLKCSPPLIRCLT